MPKAWSAIGLQRTIGFRGWHGIRLQKMREITRDSTRTDTHRSLFPSLSPPQTWTEMALRQAFWSRITRRRHILHAKADYLWRSGTLIWAALLHAATIDLRFEPPVPMRQPSWSRKLGVVWAEWRVGSTHFVLEDVNLNNYAISGRSRIRCRMGMLHIMYSSRATLSRIPNAVMFCVFTVFAGAISSCGTLPQPPSARGPAFSSV